MVPFVDSLDWSSLEHRTVYQKGKLYKGIFEWGFLYKEQQLTSNDMNSLNYSTQPYWYIEMLILGIVKKVFVPEKL